MSRKKKITYVNVTPENEAGQAHGEWIWYFPSGSLSNTSNYINGVETGLEVDYISSGDLWCVRYHISV